MIKKILETRNLFCIVAFWLSPAVSEPIYKWVDQTNHVHYSSQPDGDKAIQIQIDTTPPTTSSEHQSHLKDNPERDNIHFQNSTLDKTTKAACNSYRENLALLEQNQQRLYAVKPDGKYHYFSDEEQKAQMLSTQKLIDEYC